MSALLRPGIYRHYKGRDYAVVGVARHSETGEEMAVYRQLYGTGEWWVRPLSMFQETVDLNGNQVARFVYIAELAQQQPLV